MTETGNSNLGRVVLAGGSGFLGRELAGTLLDRGYEVVVLTRDPESYSGAGRAVAWDGRTVDETWVRELEGARALVNLAGRSVDCRRTARNRDEILRSRVESTEALGAGLRLVYRVPEVWVQTGSLAIYGNAGDRICDETGFIPDEYPTDVCIAWEEALGRAVRPEMRWAILRIGFVLGETGGALSTLTRLARLGLGGTIGSGRQWVSWIHIDDMLRLFVETIENPSIRGICNATGLQPVPNREFMEALRRTLGAPFGFPAPSWLVRLAAPFIDTDPDLALNGRRGLPVKIHGLGFRFRYHQLEEALASLLGRPVPETAPVEEPVPAPAAAPAEILPPPTEPPPKVRPAGKRWWAETFAR